MASVSQQRRRELKLTDYVVGVGRLFAAEGGGGGEAVHAHEPSLAEKVAPGVRERAVPDGDLHGGQRAPQDEQGDLPPQELGHRARRQHQAPEPGEKTIVCRRRRDQGAQHPPRPLPRPPHHPERADHLQGRHLALAHLPLTHRLQPGDAPRRRGLLGAHRRLLRRQHGVRARAPAQRERGAPLLEPGELPGGGGRPPRVCGLPVLQAAGRAYVYAMRPAGVPRAGDGGEPGAHAGKTK
eukprot:9501882-Pyramimonas_sp.AAC.1